MFIFSSNVIRDPKYKASIAIHDVRKRVPYLLIGRLGPLRVLAFVRVRWPRSGRPRR